jgi:cytosine/adenosine deaminase-related metal-dependent hydrolase
VDGEDMTVLQGRVLRFGGGCVHCAASRMTLKAERVDSVTPADMAEVGHQILMAPLANAHDHVRGLRPTALGAYDLPLELWLATLSNTPVCDPYLIAAAALGRQALGGCGSIMIHYTRPQRPAQLGEELGCVLQAVKAIGIRAAIAVSMRDTHPIGYGADDDILAALPGAAREAVAQRMLADRPPGVAELLRRFDDFAASLQDPLVDVQYGPYGLEWCSDALLRGIAERSALSGRRVHMHLLESPIQREFIDALHPGGPVRYLDSIGLLSPRLSVAHATALRPDEMELLAERGVTVSVNTSSNLHLRNGIAPMAEMARRRVPLATGLDGFTVDDDDDAFRELRLAYLLHRGVGLEPGLPLGTLLDAACHGGRFAVTGEALRETALAPGAPGDVIVLDRGTLDSDVIIDSADADLVVQRATRRSMTQMFVGGRQVVRNGTLVGLDLPALQAELDAQARRNADGYRAWRPIARQWAETLRGLYAAGHHRS